MSLGQIKNWLKDNWGYIGGASLFIFILVMNILAQRSNYESQLQSKSQSNSKSNSKSCSSCN